MGKGEQRETIPLHRELRKGLERTLLKRLGIIPSKPSKAY